MVTINPGREVDRIETFYRTQRPAEGRAWIEALAESAIQHLTREITDPAGTLARSGEAGVVDAKNPAVSPAAALPPEVLAQALEQFIHRHYAHRDNKTIPALSGLTPRQAITTPTGLERVKGLLREYQDGESAWQAPHRAGCRCPTSSCGTRWVSGDDSRGGHAVAVFGDAAVVEVVAHAERICLNSIVLGELVGGFAAGTREAKNRGELARFLDSPCLEVVPVTVQTADSSALINSGLRHKVQPIPNNDLWIAASALEHGAALLTQDAHFGQIEGLRCFRQLEDFLP